MDGHSIGLLLRLQESSCNTYPLSSTVLSRSLYGKINDITVRSSDLLLSTTAASGIRAALVENGGDGAVNLGTTDRDNCIGSAVYNADLSIALVGNLS